MDIDMIGPDDGWIVGGSSEDGCILHYDGKVWSRYPSPPVRRLWLVRFFSPQEGWAFGQGQSLHFYKGQWRSE